MIYNIIALISQSIHDMTTTFLNRYLFQAALIASGEKWIKDDMANFISLLYQLAKIIDKSVELS